MIDSFTGPNPNGRVDPWFPDETENGTKIITDETRGWDGVLHVALFREPFADECVVMLDDGSSEELSYEEARTWLVRRGANRQKVERTVLDAAWNSPRVIHVYIENPKTPPTVETAQSRIAPKI